MTEGKEIYSPRIHLFLEISLTLLKLTLYVLVCEGSRWAHVTWHMYGQERTGRSRFSVFIIYAGPRGNVRSSLLVAS